MTTDSGVDARRRRLVVTALAITQTIGYGSLFYSFAVLLEPMSRDLHTSTAVVTGAFTANVLVGALLAVPFGWWLDRHGGRALMTAGSAAGVLLLLTWSQIDTITQLYVVQCGVGVAGMATLYDAALPVVVSLFDVRDRARAILFVTVAAGFASTIYLPLCGWLVKYHGWRTSLILLALLYSVTVPLHAMVRRPRMAPSTVTEPPADSATQRSAVFRDYGFWLIAAALTFETGAVNAFNVHIVSALGQWGHDTAFSAGIAGLLGVFSVAGRLLTTGLQRLISTAAITAVVFGVQAVAAFLMPVIASSTAGAICTVIGFGAGAGVGTIAKPILLSERYGTMRYATLAGTIAMPMTVAKAFAPLAAGFLRSWMNGYGAVLIGIGCCCVVAVVAFALIAAPLRTPRKTG
jgi:predicted MFS family arabinose efflux permease